MGLLEKYQLLQMLQDGETRSYLAEEIATRRSVYVHQIFNELRPPNEPDMPSLVFAFLRSAPAEETRYFLDMGRDDHRVCIVTADEPRCLELRLWLQNSAPAEAADSPSADTPRADLPKNARRDGEDTTRASSMELTSPGHLTLKLHRHPSL